MKQQVNPPPPLTIEERAKTLGQLYSFDAATFRGDGDASQELCDAMLSLALIFNDCRDLLLWIEALQAQKPDGGPKWNRLFGEHTGATLYSYRLILGLMHETGEVLREHGKEFNGPFFQTRVLRRLHSNSRAMWDRARELAVGKKDTKGLDEFLKRVRNKSAFHYDGRELRKGYERRFPGRSKEREKLPLVSLGPTVYARRFYFADAAAQDLIDGGAAEKGLTPNKVGDALRDLAMGLAVILHAFIEARRPTKSWQIFEEDP